MSAENHWDGNRIGHAFRDKPGAGVEIGCSECRADLHAWRAEPGGEYGRGPVCGEPAPPGEGPCLMAKGHFYGKHIHRSWWPASPLLYLGAPARDIASGASVRIAGVDFAERRVMVMPDPPDGKALPVDAWRPLAEFAERGA